MDLTGSVLFLFDPDQDNNFLMENTSEQQLSCNRVPRRSLTLAQRIDVINQHKKTPSVKYLSEMYSCGRTQIQNILRHRRQYLQLWENGHECDASRIRRPQSPYLIAIGFVLNEWVKRARSYQININDNILRNFGKEIADHLKYKDFKPSNRWLLRFKRKFKLFDSQINVKQEIVQPGDRKPLSVDVIIEDLRRKYGRWKIPMANEDVQNAEFEQCQVKDSGCKETEDRVPETINNSNWTQEDSSIQMAYDEENIYNGVPDDMESLKEIETYKEALNYLGPLEQFALLTENIRAVGLINQLENIFIEQLERKSNEVKTNN